MNMFEARESKIFEDLTAKPARADDQNLVGLEVLSCLNSANGYTGGKTSVPSKNSGV